MARGSAVPPVRLLLPVNAGPRRGRLALAAVHMGLLGALGLSFLGISVAFLSTGITWSVAVLGAMLLGWLMLVPMGLLCTGAAITCLRDLVRTSPILTLSREGICDRRLLVQSVPWPEVARATVTYTRGSIGGVHLQLRHPVAASQNPFRMGTLGFYWRRRPDELHVPVLMLDVSPYALANGITRLVQRHGGEIQLEPKIRVTGGRKG